MKVGRGLTNHVYCDVDGTLLIWPTRPGSPGPGETPKVNEELVRRIKAWQKASGGQLVIWTMGGKTHAEMAARLCGLDAICIAKPDLMVDDAKAEMIWRKHPIIFPGDFPKA